MGDRFMPAVSKQFGRKPRRFATSFLINGTDAPVAVFPVLAAAGFSRAERVAVGKYEFELSDVWPRATNPTLGSVTAVKELGANVYTSSETEDLTTQVGVTQSAAGRYTLTVRTKAGTANADPGSLSTLFIWMELESAP